MKYHNEKPSRKDHPAGRFKKEYEDALKPIQAATGTPYDVTQPTIDQITTLPKQPSKLITVNESDAAWQIFRHNAEDREIPPNSPEAAAISRLDAIFTTKDHTQQGPDLIIKAFRDLDIVFFAGRLFRHVQVRWSPQVTHMAVYGHVELGEQKGTARIIMDANKVFLQCKDASPWAEMWETVVHEMTHTLSYTLTPNGSAECAANCPHNRGRCTHGQWFRLMLHSIHRRARRVGWLQNVIKGDYAPDYREGHPMSEVWREV